MNEENISIRYSHFESLNRSVIDLGNQVRDLSSENNKMKANIESLERQVNYWKIEANVDHERWMRTLEDMYNLRRSMK